MDNFLKITIGLLFIGLAMLIGMQFYYTLFVFVTALKSGWVFGSIFVRLLVIIFTIIGLNLIFKSFEKTATLKYIWTVIMGAILGFGISFITPIYNSDYGDFSDSETLNFEVLDSVAADVIKESPEQKVVAFFSTDCGHCKTTAFFLGINQEAGQSIPIYAFFNDYLDNVEVFLNENNGANFRTHIIGDMNQFLHLSGAIFPSVFLLDEYNNTIKHWSGDVVNYTALDEILAIES